MNLIFELLMYVIMARALAIISFVRDSDFILEF